MFVGVGKVDLRLHGNSSLKGKRQILKRVIERIKHRYNVSVAEVEANDTWQRARIGFAAVGNDRRLVNSTLDKVMDFIDGLGLSEIVAEDIEIVYFGDHDYEESP